MHVKIVLGIIAGFGLCVHVKIVLDALRMMNLEKKKISENSLIMTRLARRGVTIGIRALG